MIFDIHKYANTLLGTPAADWANALAYVSKDAPKRGAVKPCYCEGLKFPHRYASKGCEHHPDHVNMAEEAWIETLAERPRELKYYDHD
jgi:hypothetical protein